MTKNRLYIVILALVGQLFLHGQAATKPLLASDLASEEISVSASVPEKDRLILVSSVGLIVEEEIVAVVAAYDDAHDRKGNGLSGTVQQRRRPFSRQLV